jgi:predicted RNA-binding Zn-ribbon protein involved in translation (DUF1610 family)
MPISFSCPRCGKKLKAPDNAVGRTSKCPGCASPVTCPEPVYDAELVDAPPGGVDPYAELDADKPYALVEPRPGAMLGGEAAPGKARRPCPMCGEMIIATAAKCRYCGEIFDPILKKVGKGGKKGKLRSIASAQRNLLICILLNIVTYLILIGPGQMIQRNPDPVLSIIILCDAAVLLAAVVGGLIYTFILASNLYNTAMGIILGLLTLVPCLGLLILLMVNQKATALLQENGYEVGLLGAKAT